MNAKAEIVEHIDGCEVEHVYIQYEEDWDSKTIIDGALEDVLPLLDFEYNDGYGCQEIFGYIWYTDGTWSERGEYDGAEWWEYKKCPEIPR